MGQFERKIISFEVSVTHFDKFYKSFNFEFPLAEHLVEMVLQIKSPCWALSRFRSFETNLCRNHAK